MTDQPLDTRLDRRQQGEQKIPYLPSWPGLSRPSTSLRPGKKDVDARIRGHDGFSLVNAR
jgi:hypothetical protein